MRRLFDRAFVGLTLSATLLIVAMLAVTVAALGYLMLRGDATEAANEPTLAVAPPSRAPSGGRSWG